MKKIVFVLGNYKNGGMAMRATNLSNEFAKHGFHVEILVTRELSKNPFFETNKNVHIISLSEFNQEHKKEYELVKQKMRREIKHLKRKRYLTKYISSLDKSIENRIRILRQGIDLKNYFQKTKADIIIPFGLSYLEPVVSATKGVECKLFYAEKNAPEKEFPPKGTDKYNYVIGLLKELDGVIVQTENSKQFFDNELDNIYVINNPIKQNLPNPYQGKRQKTIVNFCRMSPQKNLDLLLDSFVKLNKDYPDYCLKIYGNTVEQSEIEYKERIISKIKELGLDDCAFVLPPAADVHQKIIDSAMFVSSSDYEGLSNSMIEAMAIGLPCICTDCLGGGTREVMVDGENGLIVPMNDVDAMYCAMKQFVENPEFAEQCGRNAAKIREKLSVEKIAQQWIDVFQR